MSAQLTTVKLTATASLLHNNLAASPTGYLVGLHNSVNSAGGKLFIHAAGQSRDGPEVSQATSVSYLHTAHGSVLCVTSSSGTHIYSEDASVMLCFAGCSASDKADVLKYHRGACVVDSLQHVAVGTSTGGLMVILALGPGNFQVVGECLPGENPSGSPCQEVASVCFNAATESVFTAHDDGELRVWTVANTGVYVNSSIIPSAGEAPVRAASLGGRVLVGYATGHIRLFDAAAQCLQAELTAHARNLTAVDVRDEGDSGQVASVGEDTVLNIWRIDGHSGQVSLQNSSVVESKLLTGVAMLQTGAAVTAYDADELFIVQF